MTIYIVLHTICFSCVSFARISFIPIYSQRSQFLCTTEDRKHGVCSIKRLHDFPLPLLTLPALDLCPSWALLLLLRPSVIAWVSHLTPWLTSSPCYTSWSGGRQILYPTGSACPVLTTVFRHITRELNLKFWFLWGTLVRKKCSCPSKLQKTKRYTCVKDIKQVSWVS